MSAYSELLTRLVKELTQLPGIGPRSAERIVMHLLKEPAAFAESLGNLIVQARRQTFFCRQCHHLSESELCYLCRDPSRDARVICVVEEPKDVIAFEKTGSFRGLYHVTLGALSPLEGIGPGELRIQDLLSRIRETKAEEIILATNSNMEGEATALYLAKILQPLGVKISRIARGLPVGSHIEYADSATLAQAIEGRTAVGRF
jgi:recombination protein RecR